MATAVSMIVTWIPSRSCSPTTASLSLLTGIPPMTSSPPSVKLSKNIHTRPGLLHSFLLPSSSSFSFPSSFPGLSFGLDLTSDICSRRQKGHGLVVRAGKAALCLTKRNRSRKSLARTHGFRRRMRTTSGRAILKRRRAKGRKVLCTKSYPSSGKRS